MSEQILRALRAPDMTHMGRVAGGMGADATDRLAGLDDQAETIRAWSPLLIPGLLQTSHYAAAAIRSRTPSLPESEVYRRVESRMLRADRFLSQQARPERFAWFIVGEAAVTAPICGKPAYLEQLSHLLEVTRRYPRLVIQILPDDASTAGTIEPFSIHALESGPRVGHLETLVGGWYTAEPEDVSRLHQAFSTVGKFALSPGSTRTAIGEVIAQCSEAGTESSFASRRTPTPTIACTSPGREPGPSA